MALVMREVNDLGSTLQRQRTEALESAALLTHVMEEIVVAVFAFDPANRLLLVNRAGAVLVGQPPEELAGRTAAALGFDAYLSGDSRRLVDRLFGGRRGRYEVRRAQFYRDGRPHHLVVITDLSQALREEEQAAWQRIVRVLSHEINNSLTPIKSIAHSLRRRVERAGAAEPDGEIQQGLSLIEERSGSLSRFIRSYAQLARLPKPQPRAIRVAALVQRIVELENRLPVTIRPSVDIGLTADSDQIEQLLINLVRNAVDASLETAGRVSVGWKRAGDWVELDIDDEGKGIAETSNLFVPFFTTKPNGSGIGLALSRQIADAHRGTIALENRVPGSGLPRDPPASTRHGASHVAESRCGCPASSASPIQLRTSERDGRVVRQVRDAADDDAFAGGDADESCALSLVLAPRRTSRRCARPSSPATMTYEPASSFCTADAGTINAPAR